MHTRRELLLSAAALAALPHVSTAQETPARFWHPKAPPLPAPSGEVIRVSDAASLLEAAEKVQAGGTILAAEGVYRLDRPVQIRRNGVSLRGATGRRDRVILDGGNIGELVRVTGCSGVTIADLTVRNVRWNGIKLDTDTNVQRARIYNCVLHNIWQRAIKGVIVPPQDRERIRPKGCRVEYCLFFNDRPKRFEDDPADTAQNFGGNYVGGIDAMYCTDWVIADNVFVGIRGRTGEARGAVFLWNDSRGCIVERNIIVDCDAGICLGNGHRGEGVTIHATGCIARNNMLTRVPENGIAAIYTRDCRILHNTVNDALSRRGRLIRVVHDNDGLVVANNLLCGPDVRLETESRVTLKGNLAKDLASQMVSAAQGNLRLTPRATEAIGKVDRLPEVPSDIDRRERKAVTDIGADEA